MENAEWKSMWKKLKEAQDGEAGDGVPKKALDAFLDWIEVDLPPSYVSFLKELDGGEYSFGRMLAVTPEADGSSEFREAFEELSSTDTRVAAKELIPFAEGGGNYFCFDLTGYPEEGEYPVVEIDPEAGSDDEPSACADSFVEFMKENEDLGSDDEDDVDSDEDDSEEEESGEEGEEGWGAPKRGRKKKGSDDDDY